MIDLDLPSFLKEPRQEIVYQKQNEIQMPEEDEAKHNVKEIQNIKLKLNNFNKVFDEKVAEDRLKKISRLKDNIDNYRSRIDKIETYLNKLNSKIEPLELEVEKLKEIRLNKSEEEKYLLHRYKTALDIHLAVVPQSDDKYMVHVSYFTTVRLDNPKYFIKLLYNTNFKCWTLIEMQPQPKNFNEIVQNLMIVQDIQGFFEAARRIFLKYKNNCND